MYKLEIISMFFSNEVETSHIFDINSVVFHFDDFNYGRRTATIILSDCNFNSSAGEVSVTQGL